MFAKIINNTIVFYPYNPQSDYPLTSFPIGDSYPDFNCYWVYPTVPNNPDENLYDPVESTPVFNGEQWEQLWTFVEKPPSPPVPNWDGFNAAMLANVEFNQITGVVLGIVPTVALGMPAALAQVSTNGVTAFALVFSAFCQIGNVSISQRETWATIAEEFNLPTGFINVVRGY